MSFHKFLTARILYGDQKPYNLIHILHSLQIFVCEKIEPLSQSTSKALWSFAQAIYIMLSYNTIFHDFMVIYHQSYMSQLNYIRSPNNCTFFRLGEVVPFRHGITYSAVKKALKQTKLQWRLFSQPTERRIICSILRKTTRERFSGNDETSLLILNVLKPFVISNFFWNLASRDPAHLTQKRTEPEHPIRRRIRALSGNSIYSHLIMWLAL